MSDERDPKLYNQSYEAKFGKESIYVVWDGLTWEEKSEIVGRTNQALQKLGLSKYKGFQFMHMLALNTVEAMEGISDSEEGRTREALKRKKKKDERQSNLIELYEDYLEQDSSTAPERIKALCKDDNEFEAFIRKYRVGNANTASAESMRDWLHKYLSEHGPILPKFTRSAAQSVGIINSTSGDYSRLRSAYQRLRDDGKAVTGDDGTWNIVR